MRSPLMLPRVALIDPELTHSMPPDLTASTGLDALTQLIEAYVSDRATIFIFRQHPGKDYEIIEIAGDFVFV